LEIRSSVSQARRAWLISVRGVLIRSEKRSTTLRPNGGFIRMVALVVLVV
jgi:hypothetical protein